MAKAAKSANRRTPSRGRINNHAPGPGDDLPDDDEELSHQPYFPPVDVEGLSNVESQVGALSSEAKVHVYRIRPGMRPPLAFVFATTAQDFSIEEIQQRYGGGEYHVKAWQKGVSGALINERFSIEGEPRTPVAMNVNPSAAPGAPTFLSIPQGDSGNAIVALGTMFQRSIQQLGELLVRMQTPAKGQSAEDLLRMFTLFDQIKGRQPDALGTLQSVMAVLKDLQPITGESGKADAWSVLQTAAEKLLPALISRTASAPPVQLPPAMSQGATIWPGGVRPIAAPRPSSPPQSGGNPLFDSAPIIAPDPVPGSIKPTISAASVNPQLALFLRAIVNVAQSGADTGTAANMVVATLDDQPEAAEAEVRAFLAKPDWFSQIVGIEPAALPFEAWFTELRRATIALLDSPDVDEDLTGDDATGISDPERDPYAPTGAD